MVWPSVGSDPIPEGFAIWVFGMGVLLLTVAWIGKRNRPGLDGGDDQRGRVMSSGDERPAAIRFRSAKG